MTMKQNRIAVFFTAPARENEAKILAKNLKIPLLNSLKSSYQYDYIIIFENSQIGLWHTKANQKTIFYIDFSEKKLSFRSQKASLRNELIARAIGIPAKSRPKIVDATAGLGRDSYILANLGYEIILLERSPVIYTLLQDALWRDQSPARQRLTLICADAIDWLKNLSHDEQPDVIYLDPMFPARGKSAAAKKEIAMLQNFIGKDEDTERLFQVAFSCAKRKVVVKRHRLAANIVERVPNYSLTGKSNRFDIYLV